MRYIIGLLLSVVLWSCETNPTDNGKETAQSVKYESAYDSINQIIKTKPNDAELYAYRAQLRLEDNDFNLALADVNRSIAVDSMDERWYLLKAKLLFDHQKFKESKEVLDAAIHKLPGSVGIMIKISELYLITGDLQQCLNWSNASLAFDVHNAEAYYLKGMAHKYGRDTVKAVTSFQTAVEQDRNHYEAYLQLALLYALENHELAPSYFDNALRIQPESIDALYGRGLYYQNANVSEKAIRDYQSIIAIDSTAYTAFYNFGYVKLLQLEEADTAKVLFERAYQLEPNYVDAKYMAGYCDEVLGNNTVALKTYRSVLEQAPTHLLAAKGVNRLE